MSVSAALPPPAQLLALAQAALLDQLDRDVPAQTLAALLAEVGHATGRRLWVESTPCSAAGHAADGSLTLPLQRRGTALGRLCLEPGADLHAEASALALACITNVVAALLRSSQAAGRGVIGATTSAISAATTATPETTERLAKIAAHVPGALYQFQLDADGHSRFPYMSERCVTLFGLQPADLARDGMLLIRQIDPAQRAGVLSAVEASRQSLLPWVQEFQLRRPDGALRWIRGCATPQPMPGGQVLWHGYFEDLTEWQALARADHGQRLAEAANRAKNEFLSRMSHELRTPLNAVLGFAQLMGLDQVAPLSAEQQRRLALIRQSGEHLLAMIDDLLDLTSIEAGRLPLALEAVLLRPLADDALAMVQAAAQRHDLHLDCAGDADVQAWADRKRLRQVLINLLSNAIKYNRNGGSVRVQLRSVAGQAVLEVHDTGLGLSAAECDQLFEPFNRLRHAQGPVEGAGIGLAVTHSLVRLMGGQIEVQSRPGQGSCFSVRLPMPAPEPTPAPAPLPGPQGTSLP